LVFSKVSHSPGLAILGVGLAVNVLTLPLYAKAEAWQAVERAIRAKLKPKVDSIKAVFKGDERMMILSTYYRQNKYHPVYALRSSAGLLLQIPFFIAAYSFLSHLPQLAGRGFFVIGDLSKPDGLLHGLNLLPILMTVLNLVASAVYAKGLVVKEKLQLYGMAIIFLALLYNSPSGLVLYWTFNNLFSLGKNIAFRLKRPLVLLYAVMASGAIALSGAALFILDTTARKRLLVLVLSAVVLVSPIIAKALAWAAKKLSDGALAEPRSRFRLFMLSCIALAVLVGVVVPISLIASSPQEFSMLGDNPHPLFFVARSAFQSLGFFLVWPALVYALFGPRVRSILAAVMAVLAVCVLINVFAFSGEYGTISRALVFPDESLLRTTRNTALLNAAAMLAVIVLLGFAMKLRKPGWISAVLGIACVSLGAYSGLKAFEINSAYMVLAKRTEHNAIASAASIEPVYTVSTSGKNVLVFMLDRAISGLIPELIQREKDIAQALEGFTWYPNTLSFNGHTMAAAPALFGGYEYTPQEINRRSSVALVNKHNEALAVMPLLFARSGWSSTISDASWANYSWIPDNSVFAGFDGVTAFNLEGAYTDAWLGERGLKTDPSGALQKNLVRFGLFKAVPPMLR
ncbi:MAG TPA: YidC/Oxa1 family membrane protein insertase, partial [Spirochaetales bacterium]|nr:YidC/Oxa1 family membrane protein insertase [Spirochaetales bacterium]